MSKKQLYTVTLTAQAVVYAESEADAERIAHEHREHIARTQGGLIACDAEPTGARLPEGWDARCAPYGANGALICDILLGRVKP